MKPPTLDESITKAIDMGATHFQLFDISKDFDEEVPEWHWDVYVGDPHKWFRIPKPWTLRLWWRGFKHYRWPIGMYVQHWLFTYYRGSQAEGCQMAGGPDISIPRGLQLAVGHLKCDLSRDAECLVHTDCDGCPNDTMAPAFTGKE